MPAEKLEAYLYRRQEEKEGQAVKLKSCNNCMVYGTDNKPLSRARVVVQNDEKILLFFSNYKLRSVRFKTVVDFYDNQQGLIRCYCELVIKNTFSTQVTEPWMADCDVLETYEVFQRQKDLREKVHMPVNATTEYGQAFSGTVQNISAGGIFLVTAQPLKVGARFWFDYRFEGEKCQIKAKILRVKPMTGGYGYGCQFYGLTNDAEKAVRKYVFQKQLERQRQAGKRS